MTRPGKSNACSLKALQAKSKIRQPIEMEETQRWLMLWALRDLLQAHGGTGLYQKGFGCVFEKLEGPLRRGITGAEVSLCLAHPSIAGKGGVAADVFLART